VNEDLRNDPVFREWAKAVQEDVVPKLRNSVLTMTIAPDGEPDIKIAVELGLSILLDKPILVVLGRDRTLSRKLAQVADAVVDVDWDELDTSAGQARLVAAIDETVARVAPEA